jgi:hypothetical protein
MYDFVQMENKNFSIIPKEHQEPHINAIIKHLDNNHGYIEASPTGSGKTFVTSYVANKLGLAMVVICPNQVKHTWDAIKTQQGAFIPILATQGEIRGSSVNAINKNFPYIKRYDVSGNVSFSTTPEFDKILDAGIFLVIDEISMMKNEDSQITSAVACMVNRLVSRPQTKSRYVLISALMLDSIEQSVTLCYLMGWTDGILVQSTPYGTDIEGLLRLVKIFLRMDKEKTVGILSQFNYLHGITSKDQVKYVIFELMKDVGMHNTSFSLPEPQVESNRFITYFNMTDDEYVNYRNAVKHLEEYVIFDTVAGEAKGAELKDSELLMKEIELCKTGIMIRETLKILEEQPTSKVIIMVDSLQTIEYLDNVFIHLGVKHNVVTGETSKPERYMIFDAFNEPSLRSRLIIATTKTIGLGISLHDIHGGFPRTTFICQRFGIMATHQAASRTIRENSKSLATVHLVYGKHYTQDESNIEVREERVISAVNRRSDIASKFHGTNALYPSHYPVYYVPSDGFNTNWHL